MLACVQVHTFHHAIPFCNRKPYGPPPRARFILAPPHASHLQIVRRATHFIFVAGSAARKLQFEMESGNVGINVPVTVPLPYFSFTGSKLPMFGDVQLYNSHSGAMHALCRAVSRVPACCVLYSVCLLTPAEVLHQVQHLHQLVEAR